jgi:hypothetical protein
VKARAGGLLLIVATAVAVAADGPTIDIGTFSRAQPGAEHPPGWLPLTFPGVAKRTGYRLVDDGGTTVMRADSRGAGSGLIRRSEADPRAMTDTDDTGASATAWFGDIVLRRAR